VGEEGFNAPRKIVFKEGENWLVFLNTDPGGGFVLSAGANYYLDGWVQAVRDVQALDAIDREDARCRLIVSFACKSNSISRWEALCELTLYNKPDYLSLLSPLGEVDECGSFYIRLLKENPNSEATKILLSYLEEKTGQSLIDTINALGSKDRANVDISERLLPFLDHPDSSVRHAAVFSLYLRDYHDAFPRIVACLDDSDSMVRAVALHWPWYAYNFRADPQAVYKIRNLLNDPNEHVRMKACLAIVGIRDVGSFYRLWAKSLSDGSQNVRHSIHLDLLFESNPCLVLILVYWPTLLLSILLLFAARWTSTIQSWKYICLTLIMGYASGALGGWAIGKYISGDPLLNAVILTPGIIMPVFLLLVLYKWILVLWRNRKTDLCK